MPVVWNSFKFCLKCGLNLSQPLNTETSARSVENDQRSLFAKPRKSTQRARLMPSNATVPQRVSSASSSGAVVQTRLQLPGLSIYKTEKEKERRGFNMRGKEKKRRVEPRHVVISVGIIGENEKPRRSETLPVSVETESIVEAAISKHVAFGLSKLQFPSMLANVLTNDIAIVFCIRMDPVYCPFLALVPRNHSLY